MKLGGLVGCVPQVDECGVTAGAKYGGIRELSFGEDFFGRDFVKVRRTRCLSKEEKACLAKSADFPSITSRDL